MSCAKCGVSGSDNFLPVRTDVGAADLIVHCTACRMNFRVVDDFATCPTCDKPAEDLETLAEFQPERTRVCRRCAGLVTSDRELAAARQSAPAPATAEPSYWMQNYSAELWRFVGCLCDNQEPDCFDLQRAAHPTRSFYCLDCQQPYSAFVWDSEIPDGRRQCPRCKGAQIETDSIATGDEIIACQKCDGRVSKHRFDDQFAVIRQEVESELAEQRALSPDCQPDGSGLCPHCGKEGAEYAVTWHNEDVRLMRICDDCGTAEFLAQWDARGSADPSGVATFDEHESEPETPEGFEELTRCCGSLAHLHPVEKEIDDDDVLLTCNRCKDTLICLTTCADPRIPKTVTKLRRALQGTFSSGEMGLPYRTAKVQRLEELKPGDQLEFQRALYSHHAILVQTLPSSGELAVIEYTGQSDAPTIRALLSSAPNKGYVARTLYKIQDVVESLHRIDYHSLDCFLPSVAIKRAESRLREADYNVGTCNCEHLCNWAKANLDLSRQVDEFKEKFRKVLQHPILGGAVKNAIGLVSKKSQGVAAGVVEDVRAELLRLVGIRKGASRQILWTILRLGLKWGIRGLPFVISVLLRQSLPPSVLSALDAGVFKPLAEFAADKLLPIEGGSDKKCDHEG